MRHGGKLTPGTPIPQASIAEFSDSDLKNLQSLLLDNFSKDDWSKTDFGFFAKIDIEFCGKMVNADITACDNVTDNGTSKLEICFCFDGHEKISFLSKQEFPQIDMLFNKLKANVSYS